MKISFIITSYNIAPYIRACLQSVADCVQDGDEVIIVDDASKDGTQETIRSLVADRKFGNKVAVKTIFMEVNSPGGVGTAGNIGLNNATGEGVFFVDGDDWLEKDRFREARDEFVHKKPDILIANYGEYDEKARSYRRPADMDRWARWARDGAKMKMNEKRELALTMIAVPWRKFYRRDFIARYRLRFPEGDFFFEDNPFHWEVCLKAGKIEFFDRLICQHRINRPGQTMASTGRELLAFFTHFHTIVGRLPRWRRETYRVMALQWLLNNMSWHMPRLQPEQFWPYADCAAEIFQKFNQLAWNKMRIPKHIAPMVNALRRQEVAGVASALLAQYYVAQLKKAGTANKNVKPAPADTSGKVQVLHEIARFGALLET